MIVLVVDFLEFEWFFICVGASRVSCVERIEIEVAARVPDPKSSKSALIGGVKLF